MSKAPLPLGGSGEGCQNREEHLPMAILQHKAVGRDGRDHAGPAPEVEGGTSVEKVALWEPSAKVESCGTTSERSIPPVTEPDPRAVYAAGLFIHSVAHALQPSEDSRTRFLAWKYGAYPFPQQRRPIRFRLSPLPCPARSMLRPARGTTRQHRATRRRTTRGGTGRVSRSDDSGSEPPAGDPAERRGPGSLVSKAAALCSVRGRARAPAFPPCLLTVRAGRGGNQG